MAANKSEEPKEGAAPLLSEEAQKAEADALPVDPEERAAHMAAVELSLKSEVEARIKEVED